jgi:hypothetical protein
MRALFMFVSFLVGATSVQAGEFDLDRLFGRSSPTIEVAGTCTLDREATSGSQKFCYYNCVDGEKVVTISATEFCPLDMD